jgi:hypothetical protein
MTDTTRAIGWATCRHSSDCTLDRAAIEAEAMPDEATVRGALIRSGLVWVIPADMFDEAVAVVTRELANGPFVPAPEPHRSKL